MKLNTFKIIPWQRFALTIFVLMGIIWMPACTDELDFDNVIVTDKSNDHNVTLLIPSVKGVSSTRGAEIGETPMAALTEEGAMHDPMLFAYPTGGGQSYCKILTEPVSKTEEYATYTFTLPPGEYRIYVVSNLSAYLENPITPQSTEAEVKNAVLNFSAEKSLNLEDGLPMVAFPTDFLEHLNGELSIPAHKDVTLTTDLRFLCSKARISLFFDASSSDRFSYSEFGKSRPDFTHVEIRNAATRTAVDHTAEIEHDFFSVKGGDFARTVYPTDIVTEEDVKNYDLNELQLNEDNSLGNKMAWQATVYLPENRCKGKDEITTLYFCGTLDGKPEVIKYRALLPPLKEGETERDELKRGKFYDISACVKKVATEFEMNVEISDFTVKSLAHILHGPFRLQVEKTDNVAVVSGEETHFWYNSDVPVSLESEKIMVDGKEMNLLLLEKMKGHENDSIVITSNPALPLNLTVEKTYFNIIAGNLKKQIVVRPFTIKPFLSVTPLYTAVEVREVIETGSNTLTIPIKFTTNLAEVRVKLTEGWDEDNLPVEFRTTDSPTSGSGKELVYRGDVAHEGVNNVYMTDFVTGNPYWASSNWLKVEYTAYDEEGNQVGKPVISEIEIFPKRYTHRVYFRPENDDWISPHIYVYQSLALPKTLDPTFQDRYRAGKPVGGFVFFDPNDMTGKTYPTEAALQYSFTGKVTFKGWSTQGGPACNDPYDTDVTIYRGLAEGFYVFGKETATEGPNAGKTGYGIKYIPPANNLDYMVSGGSRSEIHNRYDMNTDYVAAHRQKIKSHCPSCDKTDTYNFKFPGIRMLESEKYPGWWYIDLPDIASPGKALIMIHDGHDNGNTSGYTVPFGGVGSYKSGLPLFDYPDNEGWLYYHQGVNPNFVNDKPADTPYSGHTYRICFPQKGLDSFEANLMNADGTHVQTDIIRAVAAGDYGIYNNDFYYVEFPASDKLMEREIEMKYSQHTAGELTGKAKLGDFKEYNGIRYYTFTGTDKSHPGRPTGDEGANAVYRLYWPVYSGIIGINFWVGSGYLVVNNFDNSIWNIDPSVPYYTGEKQVGDYDRYRYYEFNIPDGDYGSTGWGLHTYNGPYGYQHQVSLSDFLDTDGSGIRSLYRDMEFNIHKGTPPEGYDYRIYWPKDYTENATKHDIRYAWFYGAGDAGDGEWIEAQGEVTHNGAVYYYYDFTARDYDETFIRQWGAAGIIPTSGPSWSSVLAAKTGVLFNKYFFKFDGSKNRGFVKSDFSAMED